MSIQLLHVSRWDGWAILSTENHASLVTPPYRREDVVPLDEAGIARLLASGGFDEVALSFPTLPELIDHLNASVRDARAEREPLLAPEAVASAALQHASAADLRRFLDRVNAEISGHRDVEAAQRATVAILGAPAAKAAPGLLEECRRLLTSISEIRERRTEALADAVTIEAAFPYAAAMYGASPLREFTARVLRQRSLFNFSGLALS